MWNTCKEKVKITLLEILKHKVNDDMHAKNYYIITYILKKLSLRYTSVKLKRDKNKKSNLENLVQNL